MRVPVAIKSKCGAERCRWRRRIQEQMDKEGVNGQRLAQLAGVTPEAVYRTLGGTLHTSRVLDILRAIGVKEQYLCDPRRSDVGREAA